MFSRGQSPFGGSLVRLRPKKITSRAGGRLILRIKTSATKYQPGLRTRSQSRLDDGGGVQQSRQWGIKLVPSDHGKFRISVNDELVAIHEHRPDAHLFPDIQDLMNAINERIDG